VPSETTALIPPLILIGAFGMQSVPAAARDGIIKRKLQIVVAQKPVESRPGFVAPAVVAGYAVRFETRRYRASGLNRLLIEARFFTILVIEALATRWAQSGGWFRNAALSAANPALRGRATMRSSADAEPTTSSAWGNLALP
jgi:hypothetical protein